MDLEDFISGAPDNVSRVKIWSTRFDFDEIFYRLETVAPLGSAAAATNGVVAAPVSARPVTAVRSPSQPAESSTSSQTPRRRRRDTPRPPRRSPLTQVDVNVPGYETVAA
ncbi:hypothetical protein AURDEDRAFT_174483 [Auricularia subglabra TFB-10046 SS5]|uniref:Uncharacterized protein n=1 Tax=Auricularia subglabra (strain TFB-10046 / SS5) TaxID=717982 RepID=J0WT19_AURST|nr:hypothetical protein AURDEDRAFT_174483 [Auricularia subglabra TFB-10046 SS5]